MLTKTISLADDAYEALVAVKRPAESFSELARRLARDAALDRLFDPDRPPLVSAREAQEWKSSIYAARRQDKRKPLEFG